ncbi:hypothetical protein A0O30_19615 [Pseudomonas sp. LLC-1]|uniref:glycerophosphodiester phosphodiesterase n=1 Tax=Pseudomonas sp. LLC-1 TaxID=1812180 RepID=UPI000D01C691|nr:glycerophosphodiester phosphodiesterase family protein [Pseudomonas sp. LLC-1]PRN02986.1 hypothetical protein A0O30_19615 [Pseudomonas sp. LLC-1]
MTRLIARRGAARHAPENSLVALLSAYTAGADGLAIEVRCTLDGQLVLAADDDLSRLTGTTVKVSTSTLEDLLALDMSETFRPLASPNFHYYDPTVIGRKLRIATLHSVLTELPLDLDLVISPLPPVGAADGMIGEVINLLTLHRVLDRVVLCFETAVLAAKARALAPEVRVMTFADETAYLNGIVDGSVTSLDDLFDVDGGLTTRAQAFKVAFEHGGRLGVLVQPSVPTLSASDWLKLAEHAWIWGALTDSPQETGVRHGGLTHLDTQFAGTQVDTTQIALGYAKANRFARIWQENGVHIDISPYDDALPAAPTTAEEARLQHLENGLMYTAKDWPYYSGGGLGTVIGIRGDFVAETHYHVEAVGQATTLEMAATNVDPGAHQEKPATTFRQKDSFYDPHGAPPYVGVEHDEDDGYRINWNLGVEYDSNQYGKPVGDGHSPRGARLRLERRGSVFTAYYREGVDANGSPLGPFDWVAVGAIRNESMNPTVFLRCAGKRWRQEREDDPDRYMPILANRFLFKNLKVSRFP